MRRTLLILVVGVAMISSGCGRTLRSALEDTADNASWLAGKMEGHTAKADQRKQARDVKQVAQYLRHQRIDMSDLE